MDLKDITRMKEIIYYSDGLSAKDKKILLKQCNTLNHVFLKLYTKDQELSKLKQFKVKYPTLVNAIDIVSRTFSRLGV